MSSFSQLLNISRSTMQSCMRNLDLVSNNLANVNTTAFKRSRSNFQELLSAQGESGVEMRTTQGLMDQGTLQNTENAMDVAIEGEGFFQVALADGQTAYTAMASFSWMPNATWSQPTAITCSGTARSRKMPPRSTSTRTAR